MPKTIRTLELSQEKSGIERQKVHDLFYYFADVSVKQSISQQELLKLNRMIEEFHKKNKALATLALTEGDVARSGCVKLEGDKIVYFIEKPELERAPSKLISAGFYILEPEIFTYIPKNQKYSIEKQVWTLLAKEGKLFGFIFKGQFLQTDTLEKYYKAEKEWEGFKEGV